METDRFKTKSAKGKQYFIIEYQEYLSTRMTTAQKIEELGTRRFSTEDGKAVNRVSADTFKIVQTHEVLRKIEAEG